jgi:lipopolysaccharide transport system ATP-binding protein
MGEVAISVEGLGKQYRLGGPQQQYSTLRDQIHKWTSIRSLLRRRTRDESRPPFWALRGVSFEVNRCEVLGIIGRNGAGKSTLLKILSQITEPTEGLADIFGRVGSLLEVGTGFHPELTGRENIFLNGAILGMRRGEIARKFDDIVQFSEIAKFIDTPVKYYSSGMYTRLAFAVAAHLEPEILVVDEVLAVGDAEFQKKCLGKMQEVARGGRTVLFVSHNMAAVERLCHRCILLERGAVQFIGEVAKAVEIYLTAARRTDGVLNTASRTVRSKAIQVVEGQLEQQGKPASCLTSGRGLEVFLVVEVLEPIKYVLELVLRQKDGVPVAFSNSGLVQRLEIAGRMGLYKIRCRLPDILLAQGEYSIDVALGVLNVGHLDYLESAIGFSVDWSSVG